MKFQIDFENTPFLSTSETASQLNRLNWRSEILLTRNIKAIKGKKILDLASHDGRLSYVCLKLGASHVTGVEARPHLVKNAKENFANLGFNINTYTFLQDDVLHYLPKVQKEEFDTILCFGFFYHTTRQIKMLNEVIRIKPRYFLLDTFVEKESRENPLFKLTKSVFKIRPKHLIKIDKVLKKTKQVLNNSFENKPALVFKFDIEGKEGATIDPTQLVAWPTQSFLELFFKEKGFNFKQLHWDKREINNWDHLDDYKTGKRISYITQFD